MRKVEARVAMLAAVVAGVVWAAPGLGAEAVLGAPEWRASAEKPVGWRGDGTGRFAGATPPTAWERKRTETGYAVKGIVWMTPLPNKGVASPIVVGDKVFVTTEVADLVCLDKQTGRILWIRSASEFEGLSAEERAGEAAFAEKLAPLAAELEKANAQVVDALNARAPGTAGGQVEPALTRKREIEKQIFEAQRAIDKKKFDRYWAQGVFGFAGTTPTSDGKRVYVFYTTGVTAAYDLDGNRKWIDRGAGGGSEHGNFASPLLCAGKVVVWANELRGYDAESGKLLWKHPAKAFNTYGSMFRVDAGGEAVAAFQWGFFVRMRDGKLIWDNGAFGDAVDTPVVAGDTIFAWHGYPRANPGGFKAFKIPASTEGGKLTPAYTFKEDWAEDEVPVDKKAAPFNRGYVASPLWVDGLLYRVTQGGGLIVSDAATGATVYRKVLPVKPKTEYWNWSGFAASPTLAGGLIYLMDNQGATVIIKPGREYQEVGQNVIEESGGGKDKAQTVATPVFEGKRMYYRTPGFAYCIGE